MYPLREYRFTSIFSLTDKYKKLRRIKNEYFKFNDKGGQS